MDHTLRALNRVQLHALRLRNRLAEQPPQPPAAWEPLDHGPTVPGVTVRPYPICEAAGCDAEATSDFQGLMHCARHDEIQRFHERRGAATAAARRMIANNAHGRGLAVCERCALEHDPDFDCTFLCL